jgi:hypothetical protein
MAITEIERRDWHAAYTIINARYLEKGIGDIVVFETEARSIRMQPGQPLQDHIAHLQESLKQWSSVMFVSAESIRNHGHMHLIQINVDQSTANSGNATDQEIRDMGYTVFIPEETRYDIYERSVENIKRYDGIIMIFSLKERHEKSVRLFLTALENMEKSSKGQQSFREEVELNSSSNSGNPNKKRTSLVTNTTGKTKTIADQTCKFHPGKMVRHSEKECLLNPANAGSKKSNSAITTKKDPCKWCTKNNPKLASRHQDSKCWFNPSSPSYDATKIIKPDSKSPAISPDMTDRLSKLESNAKSIKSMLTKLTKGSATKSSGLNKRKIPPDADDASLSSEV